MFFNGSQLEDFLIIGYIKTKCVPIIHWVELTIKKWVKYLNFKDFILFSLPIFNFVLHVILLLWVNMEIISLSIFCS